jgi:hypothetical protein
MKMKARFSLLIMLAFAFAVGYLQTTQAQTFSISVSPTQFSEGETQRVTVSTSQPGQINCTGGISFNGPGSGSGTLSFPPGTHSFECSSPPNAVSNRVTITVSPGNPGGPTFTPVPPVQPPGPDDPPVQPPGPDDPPVQPPGPDDPPVQPPEVEIPPVNLLLPPTDEPCSLVTELANGETRLREDPSENATVIELISSDVSHTILDSVIQPDDGIWYKIRIADTEGWVRGDVVRIGGIGCDGPTIQDALANCVDADVLIDQLEVLPSDIQLVIATSNDPCTVSTNLIQESNSSLIHIRPSSEVVNYWYTNCIARVPYLLNPLEDISGDTERISFVEAINALDESDLCTRPAEINQIDVIAQMSTCGVPLARVAEIVALAKEELGFVSRDLTCSILHWLNLLGGQFSERQLSLYQAMVACGQSQARAIEIVGWAVAQNIFVVSSVEWDNLLAEIKLQNCGNAEDIITEWSEIEEIGDLPVEIAACDLDIIALFLNQLNHLTQQERDEIWFDLDRVDPAARCDALYTYLYEAFIPYVVVQPPSLPTPSTPEIGQPAITDDTIGDGVTSEATAGEEETLSPLNRLIEHLISEDILVPAGEGVPPNGIYVTQDSNDPGRDQLVLMRAGESIVLTGTDNSHLYYPTLIGNRQGESIVAYLASDGETGETILRKANLPEEGNEINPVTILRLSDISQNSISPEDEIRRTRIAWNPGGTRIFVTVGSDIRGERIYAVESDIVLNMRERDLDEDSIIEDASAPFVLFDKSFLYYRENNVIKLTSLDSNGLPVDIPPASLSSQDVSCDIPTANEHIVYFLCSSNDSTNGSQLFIRLITEPTSREITNIVRVSSNEPVLVDNWVYIAAGPVENWLSYEDGSETYIASLSNTEMMLETQPRVEPVRYIYWAQ